MCRVVHLPVRPELGLDVLIAQQAHLPWQVLPVRPQEAPVERDRRQQCHLGPQPAAASRRGRRCGEEAGCRVHAESRWRGRLEILCYCRKGGCCVGGPLGWLGELTGVRYYGDEVVESWSFWTVRHLCKRDPTPPQFAQCGTSKQASVRPEGSSTLSISRKRIQH